MKAPPAIRLLLKARNAFVWQLNFCSEQEIEDSFQIETELVDEIDAYIKQRGYMGDNHKEPKPCP